MTEQIDLVPLSLFSERIKQGWRMVPGYPLTPGDYVVTMCAPGFREPMNNFTAGRLSREQKRDRS